MATLATLPWSLPFADVDPTRILYVYDTALPWAGQFAQDYCSLHGIPAANILALTLPGTPYQSNYVWTTGGVTLVDCSNLVLNSFMLPLRAALNARSCNTVLLGPAMPVRVLTWSIATAGQAAPSLRALPSLTSIISQLLIAIPEIDPLDPGQYLCARESASGSGNWRVATSNSVGAAAAYQNFTFITQDANTGSAVEKLFIGSDNQAAIPTAQQCVDITQRANTNTGWTNVGVIGWPDWSAGPASYTPPMTQAAATALLNNSEAALAAQTTAVAARSQPILFFMNTIGGVSTSNWQAMCNQLRLPTAQSGWALPNVKFAYAEAGSYVSGTPLPAECFATPAQIAAGTVPGAPLPYKLQAGGTLNNAIYDPATGWATVSVPLKGGASFISGPSFGYWQNLRDLASKSAASGSTDTSHLTSGQDDMPWTHITTCCGA